MSGAAGVSQADAMDRMYRLTRHVYDLTRKPYLLGRDRMIEGLDVKPGMSVLEVGCGTARNLVAVGRRYPGARLHGFDISQEMLKTAEGNARASGQEIRLAQGDATAFDAGAAFGLRQFDRVYVSYALSMIPPWRPALAHALDLVAPGGTLSVVDFGFCEGLGPLARVPLHGWLKLFHVSPRADLEWAMSDLATVSRRRLRFQRVFGGYAQIGTLGPAAE